MYDECKKTGFCYLTGSNINGECRNECGTHAQMFDCMAEHFMRLSVSNMFNTFCSIENEGGDKDAQRKK